MSIVKVAGIHTRLKDATFQEYVLHSLRYQFNVGSTPDYVVSTRKSSWRYFSLRSSGLEQTVCDRTLEIA